MLIVPTGHSISSKKPKKEMWRCPLPHLHTTSSHSTKRIRHTNSTIKQFTVCGAEQKKYKKKIAEEVQTISTILLRERYYIMRVKLLETPPQKKIKNNALTCQWRIQEFVKGGAENLKGFFCFSNFQGGSSSENSRENDISD